MKNMVQVRMIGYVGKDAEMHYTPSGKPVTQFTVAASIRYQTAEGEERKETEWLDVICWGKLAELANQRVEKGDPVFVEGRLKSRQWEHEGKWYFRNEVQARELVFLKPGEGPQVTADAERDAEYDEMPVG